MENFVWRHAAFTLTELYIRTLSHDGVRIPSFCQKLEQVVLTGQKALVPTRYVTANDCIFCFFCEDGCYIDSMYQVAVRNRNGKLNYIPLNPDNDKLTSHFSVQDIIRCSPPRSSMRIYSSLAEKMDWYIRQVGWFQGVLFCRANKLPLRRTRNKTLPTYQRMWRLYIVLPLPLLLIEDQF
jgi:hypothetical protein